jgi:hypothetical protein
MRGGGGGGGAPDGKELAAAKIGPAIDVPGFGWLSPDGKRIAYTWRQRHAELAKKEEVSSEDAAVETEMFLIVADADGSNAKTVASVKTEDARSMPFEAIDWR